MDIPTKIYLQIKDEDGETPDEITWCEDRIRDTDVEYVRADTYRQDCDCDCPLSKQ